MTGQIRALSDLLSHELIQELARPADFRYGRAIHRRGGVALIKTGASEVEAWVGGLDGPVVEGGSRRRRTTLRSSGDGLAWHCAGNPANHQIFCKHCVALALELMDEKRSAHA